MARFFSNFLARRGTLVYKAFPGTSPEGCFCASTGLFSLSFFYIWEAFLNIFRISFVHRYIVKELLSSFLLCFVSLLVFILIGRGLQMRELFLGLDLSFVDTALLFFYMIPMFMLIVVPLSCMLSVFLTFLRMSTDRELVALKSGGISLYQLLLAPLLFCFVCALMNLAISLHSAAWGMGKFRDTVLEIANTRARLVIQPGVFNQDIFGLTLFARQVEPETKELKSIILEDRTQDPNNRVTIFAKRGAITTEHDTGSLLFTLREGQMYRADGNQFGVLGFDTYEVRLDLSKVFSGMDLGDVRPKELTWEQLARYHNGEEAVPSQRFLRKVRVELEKRRALPAACVILGLFAMPLACMFEGVRRQMGIVLSLLMFLFYYSLFSFGVSISESGRVSPLVGIWMPNVFFGILGLVGLYFTARERVPTFQAFRSRQKLTGETKSRGDRT